MLLLAVLQWLLLTRYTSTAADASAGASAAVMATARIVCTWLRTGVA